MIARANNAYEVILIREKVLSLPNFLIERIQTDLIHYKTIHKLHRSNPLHVPLRICTGTRSAFINHSVKRSDGLNILLRSCMVLMATAVLTNDLSFWSRYMTGLILSSFYERTHWNLSTWIQNIHGVSKKTRLLRLIWHNFPTSQRLLIIFGTERTLFNFQLAKLKSF